MSQSKLSQFKLHYEYTESYPEIHKFLRQFIKKKVKR